MGLKHSTPLYTPSQSQTYKEVTKAILDIPIDEEDRKEIEKWEKVLLRIPTLLANDKDRNKTEFALLSRELETKDRAERLDLKKYEDPLFVLPHLYHEQMKDTSKSQGQLVSYLLMYAEVISWYKSKGTVFNNSLCASVVARKLSRDFKAREQQTDCIGDESAVNPTALRTVRF